MGTLSLPQMLDAGSITLTANSRAVTGDSDTLANVTETGVELVVDGYQGVWTVQTAAVDDGGGDGDFTIIEPWPNSTDTAQAYVFSEPLAPDVRNVIAVVDDIGAFSGRSAHNAESAGYLYLSTDGAGSATLPLLFERVTSTSGTWAAVDDIEDVDTVDEGGNPVLNSQGFVTDPYIEDAAKDDTDALIRVPWYVLCQANDVTESDSTSDVTFNRGIKLTKTTAAGRMGVAQIILNSDRPDVFGVFNTLAAKARLSAGGNLRFALLSDTGTDDTPKDLVNDWTSTTYDAAGTNFFVSTVTVEAVGVLTLATAEALSFDLATDAAVAKTQGRLIPFVWTEASQSTSATLELTDFQIVPGGGRPKVLKPPPVETVKVQVKEAVPNLATFALAPGYNVSHSNTELNPFPSVDDEVTLTVETDQWFARNVTVVVTNKSDASQAFRMRVTEYDGSSLSGIVNQANGTDVNDDWVISVSPGLPSGAFPAATSATYIGKATDVDSTVTATLDSGTIQSGDILIWGDFATSSSYAAPSGFTLIKGNIVAGFGAQVLAIRIADGTENGTTITGMTVSAFGVGAKILACFRPDQPAGTIVIASAKGQATGSAPSNQTISPLEGTTPLIKIGLYGVYNTTTAADIDPRGWSTTKDDEFEVTSSNTGPTPDIFCEIWLAYEIDNSSPASTDISMQDEGLVNFLQSCSIEVVSEIGRPGDIVVLEDGGAGRGVIPQVLLDSNPRIHELDQGVLSGSSVDIVEASSGLWATYRELHLQIIGASTDEASANLEVLVSVNSGSSFATSGYKGARTTLAGAVTGLTTSLVLQNMAPASETLDVALIIHGHQGGQWAFTSNWIYSSNAEFGIGSVSYVGSTSAINALRIALSAGTSPEFDAGTYRLIGVR